MHPQSTPFHYDAKSTYLPPFDHPTARLRHLDPPVSIQPQVFGYQRFVGQTEIAKRTYLDAPVVPDLQHFRAVLTAQNRFFERLLAIKNSEIRKLRNQLKQMDSTAQAFFDLDIDSPLYKDMEDILERMKSNQVRLHTHAEVWNE